MSDDEIKSEVTVIARRHLALVPTPEDGPATCILEIGVATVEPPLGEGRAACRLAPLTDWRWIYGVDQVQALELTIRMAEMEAKAWGADWPDDEDEEPTDG